MLIPHTPSYTPLFQSTGLENLSDKDLDRMIENDNDIFGQPMKERNRRAFQGIAPIIYTLSEEFINIWDSISELLPSAVLSIKSNNAIDIVLQDINFKIESSTIFPNTLEVRIKYLDFSNMNFIASNEAATYIQGVIEDMAAEEKEMEAKEAYYYYQSKEIQQAMQHLNEEDLFDLKFKIFYCEIIVLILLYKKILVKFVV